MATILKNSYAILSSQPDLTAKPKRKRKRKSKKTKNKKNKKNHSLRANECGSPPNANTATDGILLSQIEPQDDQEASPKASLLEREQHILVSPDSSNSERSFDTTVTHLEEPPVDVMQPEVPRSQRDTSMRTQAQIHMDIATQTQDPPTRSDAATQTLVEGSRSPAHVQEASVPKAGFPSYAPAVCPCRAPQRYCYCVGSGLIDSCTNCPGSECQVCNGTGIVPVFPAIGAERSAAGVSAPPGLATVPVRVAAPAPTVPAAELPIAELSAEPPSSSMPQHTVTSMHDLFNTTPVPMQPLPRPQASQTSLRPSPLLTSNLSFHTPLPQQLRAQQLPTLRTQAHGPPPHQTRSQWIRVGSPPRQPAQPWTQPLQPPVHRPASPQHAFSHHPSTQPPYPPMFQPCPPPPPQPFPIQPTTRPHFFTIAAHQPPSKTYSQTARSSFAASPHSALPRMALPSPGGHPNTPTMIKSTTSRVTTPNSISVTTVNQNSWIAKP